MQNIASQKLQTLTQRNLRNLNGIGLGSGLLAANIQRIIPLRL